MTAGLAALVERVAQLDPYLACSVGPDGGRDPLGWTHLGVAPAGADGWVDRLAARYGEHLDLGSDRQSQASFIILDATWYACAPLVAAYLAERALPTLAGGRLWLDGSRTGFLSLAAAEPRSPATIDDLRAEIESSLAPIVEAVVDRRWLGRRTAWWGVGDRAVGAFEYVGDLLGEASTAREEAERLVHHPGSRIDSPRHRFLEVEHLGHRRSVGLRASCCRYYRVPGGEHCLTCPLVPEPDRLDRLTAWMADELELAGAGH